MRVPKQLKTKLQQANTRAYAKETRKTDTKTQQTTQTQATIRSDSHYKTKLISKNL